MSDPTFFGNKIGADLVVARRDSFPDGTAPGDALGEGTLVLRAPDSERARSQLGALRAKLDM